MTAVRWTLTAGAGALLAIGLGREPVLAQSRVLDQLLRGKSARGCVVETRPLSFGTYSLDTPNLDGQGLVIFSCSHGNGPDVTQHPNNVRIEISRGSSNSYDRYMTSGGDHLRYNVYLDSTRTTIWGDGSSGTDYYSNQIPPNGKPNSVPAYGRIFGNQDIAVGNYSDTLQVTILF